MHISLLVTKYSFSENEVYFFRVRLGRWDSCQDPDHNINSIECFILSLSRFQLAKPGTLAYMHLWPKARVYLSCYWVCVFSSSGNLFLWEILNYIEIPTSQGEILANRTIEIL